MYYLLKQGDRNVWLGTCSGRCDHDYDWTVLTMFTRKVAADGRAGRDGGAVVTHLGIDRDTWELYDSLLLAMFGGERPRCLGWGIDGVTPMFLRLPVLSFTIRSQGSPAAARHAVWQVLRQIAFRPKQVWACVREWGTGERTQERALELWWKHLQLDEFRGENMYCSSREQFVELYPKVVHGVGYDPDTPNSAWDSFSSEVFNG